MIFSHISDTHLGFVQYHSEERENDVYTAFDEAIDTSIKDHVDFIILAGDIFHVPNPSGKAIVVLANALKRLKKNNIESFFILGEHDISRIRATPVPWVYHNLEFSKYIGNGKPIIYKDVLIAGFDKRRKAEIESFEDDFSQIDADAKKHQGHKILVLHQGITEINKFAGELNSTDLPSNFTYYAMGHLHEQELKQFSHLGGPLAYPGSTELTSSEGIKETQKGFYQVDISGQESNPTWIKLDTRPQFSIKTSVQDISSEIDRLSEKIKLFSRKPILELNVTGEILDSGLMQSQISRLTDQTLRCFWKHVSKEQSNGSVFVNKPLMIEDEMYRIAKEMLGSTDKANFAINELLPLLSRGNIEEARQAIIEDFERFKKGVENATVS
ncbi:metallophosphoesterase family protein [Candidatus Nitrosotalea okcheonensis]|uniref:Metallophosphoesterase n=1 Tax=Candidatus Nitrosotalea okcheonensis TaxID=1903276 RepID=A0A2H1FCV7_9ARCH|nr:exonuclease SbcCD subunit D [Candidatus Nitrosotalea okcheonensis]MDE1728134.1 exonuclease SbcCD subunit D [Nitrososphaerota archaeon]MDE1830893.1 exonuclease SbcCD subunit D [Nitrososphaerota archaeon]MDE1877085.1 exonuclease SbcCD subunit D [Nitrososphaerota archaeon]SMH70603.1 Metallophosphoesterase [Candidatus Nitrosotalea okcheonensis]